MSLARTYKSRGLIKRPSLLLVQCLNSMVHIRQRFFLDCTMRFFHSVPVLVYHGAASTVLSCFFRFSFNINNLVIGIHKSVLCCAAECFHLLFNVN